MALFENLKDALHETLDSNGVLNQLRARVRAEAFRALEGEEQFQTKISNENLLINELIREYFEFNHYQYALSVFLSESNQPQPPANREILLRELGFSRDPADKKIPLLYSLAFENKNSKSLNTQTPPFPLSSQPADISIATDSRFDECDRVSQNDDIVIDVRRKSPSTRREDHIENDEGSDSKHHAEEGAVHAIDHSENSDKQEELVGQKNRQQQEIATVRSRQSIDEKLSSEAVEEDKSSEEASHAKESREEVSDQLESEGSNLPRPETLSKTGQTASGDSISVHIEQDTEDPDAYSDDFETSSEEKTSRISSRSVSLLENASPPDGWRGV